MGLWQKLGNTFRRRRLQEDITDELAFHLEQRERTNRERGMSVEEARRAALRRFGNVTLANERTADSEIVQWIENAARDARLALRLLRKSPGFTATAVFTLALGIGANTARRMSFHAKNLVRVKWALWNQGIESADWDTKIFRAGLVDHAWDLPAKVLPSFQAVETKLDELRSDLYANDKSVQGYTKAFRKKERVSSAHVESTVNQLIN